MRDEIVLREGHQDDHSPLITRFQDGGPLEVKFPTIKHQRLDFNRTNFFAIGSCFAKNLANFLRDRGLNVGPNYFEKKFINRLGNPKYWICGKADETPWERVMLGHFDPMHIYKDLEIAAKILNKKETNIEIPIWELGEKDSSYFKPREIKYMSPFHTKIYGASKQYLYMIESRIYTEIAKALKRADVFIITYGLAEYLQFTESDHIAVNYAGTARQRNRCIPRLLSSNEISDVLFKTVELINSINNNAIIFLSLSPVRLARTYSNSNDVYRMGSMGKALLRVGIEEGINKANEAFGKCVYYIPSYEYVTLGNFYAKDHRHVDQWAVENIMNCFIKSYDLARD